MKCKWSAYSTPISFKLFHLLALLKQATECLDDEDGMYLICIATSSAYGASKPKPRHRRDWSRTSSSRTTLPSSPTQTKLCSTSRIALQTSRGSLPSRSVLRRRKFFISPPYRTTTSPTKPLVIRSWYQLSNSLTWAVPYHLMQRSTKKLTTDSLKPTAPLVDCTNEFETRKTWRARRRSASTGLLFLPPFSTAQGPEWPTAVTSFSSSASTSAVSAPSSTFTRVTSSQTLKFWSRLRSQHRSHATEISGPMCRSCFQNGGPSPTDDCIVWRTLHRLKREREVHPRTDTTTASKSPSTHGMLTSSAGQIWLQTVMPSATRSTKLSLNLKRTGGMYSRTSVREGRPAPPPHTIARGSALPTSDQSWACLRTTTWTAVNLWILRSSELMPLLRSKWPFLAIFVPIIEKSTF